MDSQPDRILAAGGVLWREADDSIEITGIYRPATDNWSLPKGKLSHGEHPLAAACREVEEETGVTPIPQTYLTSARYELPRPDGAVVKIVEFWSMRAAQVDAEFTPGAEVTQRRWMSPAEAEATLTRPRDQQTLRAFRRLPRVDSTVIILRHARADDSVGVPDAARTLDASGREQTAQLRDLLALYRPQQLISATPTRCLETVDPLAEATRLPIVQDSIFNATAHMRRPDRATQRLRELAEPGRTTVVCSQEPVIVEALADLAHADDLALADVKTPPGTAWVLSFSGSRTVAVERL